MNALKVFLAAFLVSGLANVAIADTKLKVGVALPRAQLGQPNGAFPRRRRPCDQR